MKTLEQAIGCWTVNVNYNSLEIMAGRCLATARTCKRYTRRNLPPNKLLDELFVLQRQVETFSDLTKDAIRRCREIIDTNELEKEEVSNGD